MQFRLKDDTTSVQVLFKVGMALNVGELGLIQIAGGRVTDLGDPIEIDGGYAWTDIVAGDGEPTIQLQIFWRVFDAQGHNGPYATWVTVLDQAGDKLAGYGNHNPARFDGLLGDGDVDGVDRQRKAISVW